MDPHYLPRCGVFIFDGKNDFEIWRSMMKNFFKNIRVLNIIQKGFMEPIEGTELSRDAVEQLERNRQLNYKALYYLHTQVQLHVAKKFIHVKTAKEAWKFLTNSYGHGEEEEEKEVFDEAKKEEIVTIVDTHENEEIVIEEEISQVVEKESEIIDQIKDVIEDHDDREIVDFIEVDESFEEKNQVMRLVEINCEVDKLIEGCDTAKVDAVVSAEKLKEKYGDVENLIGKNYDFLIFGDFIGDMDELNCGVSNKELVDIFEFFYKSDQEKKLFENYKSTIACKDEIRDQLQVEIPYHLYNN